MTASGKAVFVSYASEDAVAAQRLCDSLRAGGIEVWFDQSELRSGDTWDQKIRGEIRDCALFVPLISANTQRRTEGYFRLEWKLAVPLGAVARAKESIKIVGWSRSSFGPIATVDRDGNLHRAPGFDVLLELVEPYSPAAVTLDLLHSSVLASAMATTDRRS
jgi:hypothetical protein